MPATRSFAAALLTLTLTLAGCGETGSGDPADEIDRGAAEDGAAAPRASPDAGPDAARPTELVETLAIEGMREPIQLRLFQADDFVLPFTAYVPAGMEAAATSDRAVHFTAAFDGTRQEDAFVHLYVFPQGTDRQAAVAAAKAYKTGRGLPVSQGLEPIADEPAPPHLEWAIEDFRFRYQAGGQWFAGTLGIGRHADRHFMIVRHRPVEFGDGLAPRADLILETWLWADGTSLHSTPQEPPPIVEGVGSGGG